MIQRLLGPGVVMLLTSLFAISASAVPITGELEFTAKGDFLCYDGSTTSNANCSDGTNEAVGFDFKQDDLDGTNEGTGNDGDGFADTGEETGNVSVASGDIRDIIDASGDLVLEVFDFDFFTLPSFEWIDAAEGLANNWLLKFEITGGSETDESTADNRDLAGTGNLSLVCFDNSCDSSDHSFDTTLAKWTLSNAGALTVTGATVPEPAPLGLLGLALIVWGISRRRMRGAA